MQEALVKAENLDLSRSHQIVASVYTKHLVSEKTTASMPAARRSSLPTVSEGKPYQNNAPSSSSIFTRFQDK
jgi:hypothetical protein